MTIHTWSIFCGLSMLHADGTIRLSVRDRRMPRERSMWLEVDDRWSGSRRAVNIDLTDGADDASPRRNELADVVYKRSHVGGPARPLGLVAGMRSGDEKLVRYGLRSSGGAVARRSTRDLRAGIAGLLPRARPPRVTDYVGALGGGPSVLYQVRSWEPGIGVDPEDRLRINDQRADLIGALRSEFGPAFVGGFVPTDHSRREYPSLLSAAPTGQAEYLRLVQRSAVAVSTVGLHGSNPWKLVEYLAGARAIVSEPLHYRIPEPLDGCVDTFVTVEQCVEVVGRLLADPDLRRSRQVSAQRYWQEFVRPDRLLIRRLTELFGDAGGDR